MVVYVDCGGRETQNLNKKCRTMQVNLHNHIPQYFGGTIYLSRSFIFPIILLLMGGAVLITQRNNE